MPDDLNQPNAVPAPPPGFSPVQQNDAPAPPPGFRPVNAQTPPTAAQSGWDLSQPRAAGGEGPLGAVKGFGKGVLDTTSGIGELVHAIPAVGPAIIPSEGLRAEEKMAEKNSPAEEFGGFIENLGEYASGEEALDGLTRIAKLEKLAKGSATISNILDKTPDILKKVFKGAAKAGTVGGAQGAVKGASEGQGDAALAVTKAEQGAKEGAAGAAIGSTVAEGVGAVAKPIAQKVGLATEELDDAARSLQPGKRNYKFAQNWAQARERISQEVEENGTFKNMQEAADRFRDVRTNLWNDEVAPAIARHANETFDASKVANAVRAKITPQMAQHAPEEAKIMTEFANKYTSGTPNFGGARTVADAEKDLEFFNAQLEKEQYWKKTPQERAALEKVDGTVASRAAAVEQLREGLYDHLENAGEKNIKDLKKTYGAISSLENDVRGQVNVVGRNRPISLKQVIGLGAGLAHGGPAGIILGVGAPIFDKFYNSPEALLNRAASKAAPAGAVKAAVQDVVSGAGTVAKKAAPVAGENLLRFQGSDGGVYFTPADKKDEILKKDPGAKFQ